ncbi:protein SRG1 [Hibiscus syriacus]|uniref:Protein SRG1 n=1 Tax=Hibiscus syriacus TaxID=106335 RepID=A0A6A3BSR6_HIBSY|nr:protein SRG1 [Hibiscus syriacus]
MAATSSVEDQFNFSSTSSSVQELVKEPIKTIPQQYLVNHEVNSLILEKVKEEIEGFYKLPLEEKMKYKMREGDVEGYGNIERDEGKLDWADRNTLESYILEVQSLGKKLLCLMAKALKMEEKEMMECFEDGMQSLRMSYYPPCPQPELVMGITPHSDSSLITILHQLNGVWFPVSFLPNALVVNVGDNLEIFSNGVYRSIEHSGVGPSPSLINPHNPPLFKRVSLGQYVKGFFSQKLNGKSYLQHMRIDDNGEDNSA